MSRTLAMPVGSYIDTPNALLFGVQFTNRTATVPSLSAVQVGLFAYLGFTLDGVVPPTVDAIDTFPEVSTELGLRLRIWAPSTGYAAGQYALSPTGQIIRAKATFSSAATYVDSNWDVLTGTGATLDDSSTSTAKVWSGQKVSDSIATAITALVGSAPGDRDTIQELAALLTSDENAATALLQLVAARTLSANTVTLTASGVLTGNARNAVNAAAAAITATLPAPTKQGQLLIVERVDTSSTYAVTIAAAAGATLRGNASATISLPATGVASESLLLFAESLTSWTVAASHKPLAWLKTLFAPLYEAVTVIAASGSAVAVSDPSIAAVTDATLTANATITLPALPAAGTVKTLMLVLRQDATGARTVTWPANVKWPGALAPILSTAGGKHDLLTFSCYDGATWTGLVAAQGI